MKQKSSTIELVTQKWNKKVQLRVSNSKVKQKSSTIELVTQGETRKFNYQVSNSKWNKKVQLSS